ncbi:Imidazolonepropionase [Amycolatopsis arida]|uniref:Imidazolonepropionase n=1 Tax=Amycolatopsis arida TaxID=587909 RepID=A0A1I6B1X2_9PSEU|nr:amidohydrolase family protein [Amycolatopsis arida]TDX83564.1 imidazolonepropionase-like amidohydrolase [Amycolatopsis arida]SFQ74920.1 Imidazolonepropionase [Amycolatopsis arida]
MVAVVLAGAGVVGPDDGSITCVDVRVVEGRITAIGVGLDGDDRVDCGGGVLIPGLIDCHAHVAFPRPEPLPRSARVLEAVPVLRRLLARGVTTVRDAWGADAGLPHALRGRWITGPDLLISLRQLSPSGGLGDEWAPDLGAMDRLGDPSLPDPVFDGADGARAAVRRMVRAGADWIKVGASGSLRSLTMGRDIGPTGAELAALVDEARRCGRDVMAHAHTATAVTAAASAGARSIEHGVFLDEQSASAMRWNGCWYVPTLAPLWQTGDDEAIAAHRRSVELATAAGVPIAAGSDMAPRPHLDLLAELPLLANAGLGHAGAIKAATSEAARLLRLDHDRGRIEPGLRADLVLLDGPGLAVEDLAGRVRAVWHDGHRVSP